MGRDDVSNEAWLTLSYLLLVTDQAYAELGPVNCGHRHFLREYELLIEVPDVSKPRLFEGPGSGIQSRGRTSIGHLATEHADWVAWKGGCVLGSTVRPGNRYMCLWALDYSEKMIINMTGHTTSITTIWVAWMSYPGGRIPYCRHDSGIGTGVSHEACLKVLVMYKRLEFRKPFELATTILCNRAWHMPDTYITR